MSMSNAKVLSEASLARQTKAILKFVTNEANVTDENQ
jgi:hypothetical protein